MGNNTNATTTVQETAHERVHVLFKNDRKKIFPFMKIALGRTARSSKELLKLEDKEAKEFLTLLNFFVKEMDDSYDLNEVKGEMHRHYLWKSTREELRILYLMRKGYGKGEIARLLQVSVDWVYHIQYKMIAKGAALGRFSHIEKMAEEYSRDESCRELMKASYNEDLELFAERLSFKNKCFDKKSALHLAAYYAREMVAKALFGGNFEMKELTI